MKQELSSNLNSIIYIHYNLLKWSNISFLNSVILLFKNKWYVSSIKLIRIKIDKIIINNNVSPKILIWQKFILRKYLILINRVGTILLK